MVFNISDLYDKKYYVYEHRIDGKTFYVGKGTAARAVDLISRNNKWEKVVDGRLKEIEVVIIESFHSDGAALLYETIHIKNLLNKGVELVNSRHNNKRALPSKSDSKFNVIVENEGVNIIPPGNIGKYLTMHLIYKNQEEMNEEINIIYDYLKVLEKYELKSPSGRPLLKEEVVISLHSEVIDKYLNKYLTTEDKNDMCVELNILNNHRSYRRWRAIKAILESNGYGIRNCKKTIGDKRINTTIITPSKNN